MLPARDARFFARIRRAKALVSALSAPHAPRPQPSPHPIAAFCRAEASLPLAGHRHENAEPQRGHRRLARRREGAVFGRH